MWLRRSTPDSAYSHSKCSKSIGHQKVWQRKYLIKHKSSDFHIQCFLSMKADIRSQQMVSHRSSSKLKEIKMKHYSSSDAAICLFFGFFCLLKLGQAANQTQTQDPHFKMFSNGYTHIEPHSEKIEIFSRLDSFFISWCELVMMLNGLFHFMADGFC